jgi:hypothetical protein
MIIAHPRFDWKLLQLKMTDMVFVIMTVLAFSLLMALQSKWNITVGLQYVDGVTSIIMPFFYLSRSLQV